MTQQLTFITMCAEPETAREIKSALAANDRTRLLKNVEGGEQLYADATRLQPSAALIVLGADPEQDVALIKRLSAACPGIAIIIAARNASPALVMNGLRAGAREFLQLPVNPEELKTVLDRTTEFDAGGGTGRRSKGRAIAVFSAKGGSGTSFIATNLAAAIEAPTLLVDLNLQAGDLDSYLNKEPRYSIADLVKNRQRLDDQLVASYVTQHSPRLALLAAPLEAHEADDIRAEYITEVLHLLRDRYRCIVLDLEHSFSAVTVEALDQADDVLLVMTLDIPSLRNTKRALKIFDRIGYPRSKVHVLMNRWSKNVDLELQKVEHHLGEQFVGFVPNDYKKVMDSINLGQPLVESEPASKISAEIKRIAKLFYGAGGTPEPQPRRGVLRSLFGRQAPAPAPMEFSAHPDEA